MSRDESCEIQNFNLCDIELTQLETWQSPDHASAQGTHHEVKYSQGNWFFSHKVAERELGRSMLKHHHQICNCQHFGRKLQSDLLVKKACQRLVELGRQGGFERRKIRESAGYSTNYGGVSKENCTHFNLLANKIDYRMNHAVNLYPIDPPLRTLKSQCERKFSVVKIILQNQYRTSLRLCLYTAHSVLTKHWRKVHAREARTWMACQTILISSV